MQKVHHEDKTPSADVEDLVDYDDGSIRAKETVFAKPESLLDHANVEKHRCRIQSTAS